MKSRQSSNWKSSSLFSFFLILSSPWKKRKKKKVKKWGTSASTFVRLGWFGYDDNVRFFFLLPFSLWLDFQLLGIPLRFDGQGLAWPASPFSKMYIHLHNLNNIERNDIDGGSRLAAMSISCLSLDSTMSPPSSSSSFPMDETKE